MKPGGVFVFFDLHGGDGPEEHERYLSTWRRYWTIRGMTADEKRRFDARIREGIHFAPASRIIDLAREAGLIEPRRFYTSLLYGGWTFRRLSCNLLSVKWKGRQCVCGYQRWCLWPSLSRPAAPISRSNPVRSTLPVDLSRGRPRQGG